MATGDGLLKGDVCDKTPDNQLMKSIDLAAIGFDEFEKGVGQFQADMFCDGSRYNHEEWRGKDFDGKADGQVEVPSALALFAKADSMFPRANESNHADLDRKFDERLKRMGIT